jgi:hypothetical protein
MNSDELVHLINLTHLHSVAETLSYQCPGIK